MIDEKEIENAWFDWVIEETIKMSHQPAILRHIDNAIVVMERDLQDCEENNDRDYGHILIETLNIFRRTRQILESTIIKKIDPKAH